MLNLTDLWVWSFWKSVPQNARFGRTEEWRFKCLKLQSRSELCICGIGVNGPSQNIWWVDIGDMAKIWCRSRRGRSLWVNFVCVSDIDLKVMDERNWWKYSSKLDMMTGRICEYRWSLTRELREFGLIAYALTHYWVDNYDVKLIRYLARDDQRTWTDEYKRFAVEILQYRAITKIVKLKSII